MGKVILCGLLTVLRNIILQDYFFGYRQTRKVVWYTQIKLLEEIFLTFLVFILIDCFLFNDVLFSLLTSFLFIHLVLAFLSPPLQLIIAKRFIQPASKTCVSIELCKLIEKVSPWCASIFVSGSIINQSKSHCSDIDLALVPKSFNSAVFLTLYVQVLMFRFMTRQIRTLPDVFVVEANIFLNYTQVK